MKKLVFGALEFVDLSELGIRQITARIDTGAATSALHVENLEEFKAKGKRWVRFDLHPDIHNTDLAVQITLRVRGRKKVKNTSAEPERRVVIETMLGCGKHQWPIKLTLTDRTGMMYPMLLGREAMEGRIVVDPEHEFLHTGKH